jgi:Flp pilus assembly protein TadB
MSSTAMVSPTGLAPQVNQRPALPSRRQKRLTRRLHRNGDSPAGKFFLSLGIAAVLGVLAAVFAEIAILSLVLLIAGGVFLFVALWFLIRWLYYYW